MHVYIFLDCFIVHYSGNKFCSVGVFYSSSPVCRSDSLNTRIKMSQLGADSRARHAVGPPVVTAPAVSPAILRITKYLKKPLDATRFIGHFFYASG